jgi:hypothetical protein
MEACSGRIALESWGCRYQYASTRRQRTRWFIERDDATDTGSGGCPFAATVCLLAMRVTTFEAPLANPTQRTSAFDQSQFIDLKEGSLSILA